MIEEMSVVDFKNSLVRLLAWVSHETNTADTAFVEETIV
jgi:hypothetical protein